MLWLEEEGRLYPQAGRDAGGCVPRDPKLGLVGLAMKTGKAVLINDAARLRTLSEGEPELRGAGQAAIMPLITQGGLHGALAVWRQSAPEPFDGSFFRRLETLALLAGLVLENDRLYRVSVAGENLAREVGIGAEIQRTLLLGRSMLDFGIVRAAAITIPSGRVSGDFHDFFSYDQSFDLLIGDVMGKGIPAALLGAATKNSFLRAFNHLLAAQPERLPQPRDILAAVNAELVQRLVGVESFVTVCYARLELARRRLEFVDCGHTRIVHFRRTLGTCQLLHGENMPLGFQPAEVYEQISVPFEPGDVFFFYSDGVTETANAAGVRYGEERLAQLIAANHQREPRDLVELVRTDLFAFSGSDTLTDDLTCVAITIQDGVSGQP